MMCTGDMPAREISLPYRAKPVHLIPLLQTCRLLYVDHTENMPWDMYT